MLIRTLNDDLKAIARELEFPEDKISVTYSDRPDLCQFQCNGAFGLAKVLRRAPLQIAQALADKFAEKYTYAKAEVAPPGFLNFTVTDEAFSDLLKDFLNDPRCGVEKTDAPRKIVVDYGGPNIAKPLHVGHLRSAVIGEALKRLCVFLGHDVTGDIHLGDWGTQMGLVIAGLAERFDLSYYFGGEGKKPEITLNDLNEIYPMASARSKEDEEFRKKAQDATYRLQNHEKGYYQLWQDVCATSIADIKKDYASLNVEFDLWNGESTCDKYVNPMIDSFIEKGLAYESEGALVMDVAEETDEKPMPPIILRKSNGAQIYASTDLATIVERMETIDPDEMWYVVDARQGLHFEQVFRCARKTGLVKENTLMMHVPFGTVNGTDGKPFKTREGGTMKLKDLIALISDAAGKQLSEGALAQDPDAARKVGCSALKFGDLVCNRNKNYVFDIDKFVQFDGKTGSYLLYTLVRINSLLAKAGQPDLGAEIKVADKEERDVLMKMQLLVTAYGQAFEEKLPSFLCEGAYDLANAFNVFYGTHKIMSEADPVRKNTWIALSAAVGNLLKQTLDVLGMETVPAM
ncbi:MAG: arginine--tRNA ligase [Clostridia bacterium]|nr:arginine--tRNA ligase [Clostridia bacterium]